MMREVLRGSVAGAAGTLALNATSYLDMVVRGRGPSEMPEQMVDEVADRAGIDLSSDRSDGSTARHRRSGLAALSGHLTGIGVGVAYALVRPRMRAVPTALAGLAAGAAAMALTDAGVTSLGLTDPREWGAQGWVADVVPHAAYGLVTAVAFDRLQSA